jgi:hypothetical protein
MLGAQWQERFEQNREAKAAQSFVPPALIVVCSNAVPVIAPTQSWQLGARNGSRKGSWFADGQSLGNGQHTSVSIESGSRLFRAQSEDWVNPCRTSRRQVTGKQGDRHQHQRYRDIGQRVSWTQLVEQVGNVAA